MTRIAASPLRILRKKCQHGSPENNNSRPRDTSRGEQNEPHPLRRRGHPRRRHDGRLPERRVRQGVEDRPHRHRGRLPALQLYREQRDQGLRHRYRQGAVREDEGHLHLRGAGLGRHHPRAAGRQVRRHRRLDVDHRGAQEADRLLQEVLQDARHLRGAEGFQDHRHLAGRAEGQEPGRAGLDHPLQLSRGRLRQGRRRG